VQESEATSIEAPPKTIAGILRRLGPGLIIAASIVGSGELIATTKTGAQAGFWLLWLIVIGCVIKLFAQVEFGRYAISSGKTTMTALNELPGRLLGANWIIWYWMIMFVVSLAQLGGILGGIGQTLAINAPIDGSFNQLLQQTDLGTEAPFWTDDIYWAVLIAIGTAVLLVIGRYQMVQNVSMFLVASFTVVTVFCVFALQLHERYAIHLSDIGKGLSFRLPPAEGLKVSPLATALATFGIIGVGATELISYPYWCLEKGYARFTGPREDTPQWAERARGWMRVMRWDACISMLVFTFATVAFYMLGAAVLHTDNLDPAGNEMIRALARPYQIFGPWGEWVFLFGALAVLYSTFFVANAGHTRVASDVIRVVGAGAGTDRARLWWVKTLCVVLPLVALAFCMFWRKPAQLILASGVMQAIMLPMLGGATLYFRYRRCDRRIAPGRLWDLMLWFSVLGLLLAGGWLALTKLFPGLEQLG